MSLPPVSSLLHPRDYHSMAGKVTVPQNRGPYPNPYPCPSVSTGLIRSCLPPGHPCRLACVCPRPQVGVPMNPMWGNHFRPAMHSLWPNCQTSFQQYNRFPAPRMVRPPTCTARDKSDLTNTVSCDMQSGGTMLNGGVSSYYRNKRQNDNSQHMMNSVDLSNIIAIDRGKKPGCLEDAITMYIDFLVLENQQKIYRDSDIGRDRNIIITNPHFERELYFREALQKNIPFPTTKFRNWIKLYGMDIEVGEAEMDVPLDDLNPGPILPQQAPNPTTSTTTIPMSTSQTSASMGIPTSATIPTSPVMTMSSQQVTSHASPNLASLLSQWAEAPTPSPGTVIAISPSDMKGLEADFVVSRAYASDQSLSDSSVDYESSSKDDSFLSPKLLAQEERKVSKRKQVLSPQIDVQDFEKGTSDLDLPMMVGSTSRKRGDVGLDDIQEPKRMKTE